MLFRNLWNMKMKKLIPGIFSMLLILIFSCAKQNNASSQMTKMTHNLLALGDSYTIGESVLPSENFPSQTAQLLKKEGFDFKSPEIIAKTGWTTDELQDAINKQDIQYSFDFVTLLIGVNNQYRGRTIENYKPEFENLLNQAIRFAGNDASHVFVLSIPDWEVTPFAQGRDGKQIAKEIDAYNAANKSIAEKYKVHYIDITPGTREAATDVSLLQMGCILQQKNICDGQKNLPH
jgi:lysophospholipase L1-like esterase